MRGSLKIAGALLVVTFLAGAGFYVWASVTAGKLLSRTFEIHDVDFAVPFPLTDEETARLELTEEEAVRLATERALERGEHLVAARYGCGECHGRDFSGGVMVDDPMLGRLLGPNLTMGAGGRTGRYGPADWDRIVRHGVLPDGRPAAMPSEDFRRMSDQELSDIIAYIRAQPPVDNEVPPVTLGPLGRVLVATGRLPLSADRIAPHDVSHAPYPPATRVSTEFGQHLAGVCTGCHGEDLAGGPVTGGDPGWPPALNLTPDPTGLDGWSYRDFVVAMREGRTPDGRALREPMALMTPYARRMTDVELEALWTYLRSVPPVANGF